MGFNELVSDFMYLLILNFWVCYCVRYVRSEIGLVIVSSHINVFIKFGLKGLIS